MKKIVTIILVVLLLLGLSGCQKSDEAKYADAQKLLTEGKLEDAVKAFTEIESYQDSSKYLMYIKAIQLAEGGQYEPAMSSFTALKDFKDSELMITYYTGRAYQANQQYEEAIPIYKTIPTFKDCAERITACEAGIPERDYNAAKALYDEGKYVEAYTAFSSLKGYKDVDTLLAEDENLKAAPAAARDAKYAVGNYVTFGTYPQTKAGDDATAIEWLVIDRDGQKALLISRYALDCQPYNTEYTDVTWETCSLRAWLNGTFLNKAFIAEEQTGIITTTVDNGKSQGNSEWSTSGGNNTEDKVFLLSYAEAKKYFKDNDARMCAPTDYAVAQGGYTSDSYKVDGRSTGWWWICVPGSSSSGAFVSDFRGGLSSVHSVSDSDDVVRPALWINLESGIF